MSDLTAIDGTLLTLDVITVGETVISFVRGLWDASITWGLNAETSIVLLKLLLVILKVLHVAVKISTSVKNFVNLTVNYIKKLVAGVALLLIIGYAISTQVGHV